MKAVNRILAASLMLAFMLTTVSALRNPAAVYCTTLGYNYTVESTVDGDIGYCIMPGNTKAEAWVFLEGMEAQNQSYCTQKGYQLKTINDPAKCVKFLTQSCAVCVLANGTETEVTSLMGLTFAESTCGDGICGYPENYASCPKDCPSGELDRYCDGASDGKCDPDCVAENQSQKDPDCTTGQGAETTGGEQPEQPQQSTGCLGLLTLTLTGLTAVGIKVSRIL